MLWFSRTSSGKPRLNIHIAVGNGRQDPLENKATNTAENAKTVVEGSKHILAYLRSMFDTFLLFI